MEQYFDWELYVSCQSRFQTSAKRTRRKPQEQRLAATRHLVASIAVAFQRACQTLTAPLDMENHFPWCLRILLDSPRELHSTILQDPRYRTWFETHLATINLMESIATEVRQSVPTNFGDLHDMIAASKQIPKVPRYVAVQRLTPHMAFERLMDSARFFSAHALLAYQESLASTADCCVLEFLDSTRLEVLGSLNKIAQSLPSFNADDSQPWIVVAGRTTSNCYLVLPNSTQLHELRIWLIGDLITDASAIRKHTTRLAPLFVSAFYTGSNRMKYIVLRTLLRLLSVCRVMGKGILEPNHPAFALYHHLPTFLALFDLPRAIRDAFDVRHVVFDSNDMAERLTDEQPTLLRGLKSFLQLSLPHFVNPSILTRVRDEIHQSEELVAPFQVLLNAIDVLLPNKYLDCDVALHNVTVESNGETLPVHVLLYGFALSPLVCDDLRRDVFLGVYVAGGLPIPRPVKLVNAADIGWHPTPTPPTSPPTRTTPPSHTTANLAFIQLFLVLERLSFLPFHVSRRDVETPSSDYRGNRIHDTHADFEAIRSVWPREFDYTIRLAPSVLSMSQVWVHRWPEYNLALMRKNPFLLETIVDSLAC